MALFQSGNLMTRLRFSRAVALVPLLLFATYCKPVQANPAVEGEWSSVFTWGMGGGYEAIHVHLLPTGKVLFWQTWAQSTGLWDPVTDQFSLPQFPGYNIFCSGHTFLPDGRLFVVGGQTQQGAFNGENKADIYNPFTNTWANSDPNTPNVPDMGPPTSNIATTGKRWYPSATALGNGDVLVTSGTVTQSGITNRTVQIYEYATNSWRDLPGALRPSNSLLPEYPRTFLAPDGRAVVLSNNHNQTEILDMSGDGAWSILQHTLDPNLHNYGPAVMYDTGKIAYMGGGHVPTRNISLLDLNDENPAWRYGGGGTTAHPAGSPYVMELPRRQNDATILADGTVLITGGTHVTGWNDPNGMVARAEIWDPVTEHVIPVAEADESIYRGYHSCAILLPDGRVLVTGGDHDYGGFQNNLNAEIYSPPYLFAADGSPAVRPEVVAAPAFAELGQTIFVETPDAASIAKTLWVAPGSVTHSQNWSQRANILDFAVADDGVSISLPANGNEAPPGYYMLFLVNDQGVPSMAEWIQAGLPTTPVSAADFNSDGLVDGADLAEWQTAFGLNPDADADGDGFSDGHDFLVWQREFGSGASSLATSEVVPEPSTLVLIGFGVCCAIGFRRRPV